VLLVWHALSTGHFVRGSDFTAKIDEYLQAAAEVLPFNGSVLVKHEGKILAARGIGKANLEHEVANTPQTKFRIGSISKSFTALLVLQQVDEGRLRLENSIDNYLTDSPEAWKPITVHHLLCHTGGIYNYTDSLEWLTRQATLSKPEKLLPIFRDKPLRFAPGDKFEYSNSGYVLLGMILQKVTGKSYETLVHERITEPLGMLDTGYDRPDAILAHRAAGYRATYGTTKNARYLDMASADAAGALYSTVEDLSKYDDALSNGKLLSTEGYAKLFSPVKDDYAYGWVIEVHSGKRQIWHNGGINGFASSIVRRPDSQSCVVVLSNFEDGPADHMSRDLMALIQNEEFRVPRRHVAVAVDPVGYDALSGSYQLEPTVILTVTRDGDRLLAQLPGEPKFEIFPESECSFFCKASYAELSFFKNDAGQVTHLVLHKNGLHVRGERLPDSAADEVTATPDDKQ